MMINRINNNANYLNTIYKNKKKEEDSTLEYLKHLMMSDSIAQKEAKGEKLT